MGEAVKKKRRGLNTYEILFIILAVVSIVTWFAAGQEYTTQDGETAVVVGATLHDFFMAPINGFHDAGDVIGFVFCLGAFLALVNATGALETGIHVLVRKMKGHESRLIVILMALFALGGTTYGMCEETVGFYVLLASTMLAAGMDPMVGAATVLLGAGVGCLGSTINPFATGAAVSGAASMGVEVNMATIDVLGLILLVVSWAIAVWYVLRYAKKVKENKGSILTQDQLEECKKAYGNANLNEDEKLTQKQKTVLWLFAITFIVMIISFIPWYDLTGAEEIPALNWTSFLTGNTFGLWWFDDAATWFFLMGIIIGLVGIEDKSRFPEIIFGGFADMISVNCVIALARGTSVIMKTTGFGTWMVEASVDGLTKSGMSAGLFGFFDYLLHIGLSFLVPSSSGLAAISAPIVAPIVDGMGWSVEAALMITVAANGLVNLITPTAGAMMGGLALARIPYATYVKWGWKVVVYIGVAVGVVLVAAMALL